MELPDARPGDVLKDVSLGLGGGANAFSCVVSCCQNVKISKGLLKMHGF